MVPVRLGFPLHTVSLELLPLCYALIQAGSAMAISCDARATITCWPVTCSRKKRSSDFFSSLWDSCVWHDHSQPKLFERQTSASHLCCTRLYSTGIRRSQIQTGISLAVSFAPHSTTSPGSYLDLICPTPFLLLFSFCLTGVLVSQPGQI